MRFYSKLVRLKVACIANIEAIAIMFLFQTGSIKSKVFIA